MVDIIIRITINLFHTSENYFYVIYCSEIYVWADKVLYHLFLNSSTNKWNFQLFFAGSNNYLTPEIVEKSESAFPASDLVVVGLEVSHDAIIKKVFMFLKNSGLDVSIVEEPYYSQFWSYLSALMKKINWNPTINLSLPSKQ